MTATVNLVSNYGSVDSHSAPESLATRLGLGERFSYSFGDFAGNALFGITGSFLLYFYTNIYGITPAEVALLMLVARIIDSAADPVIGYLIDRQTLFDGRVRPFLKWFAVPFGLFAFLCFVPLPLGHAGRLFWAYFTYLVMGITFSLVIVPYGVLPNVMTRNPADRLSLATFRMFGAVLGVSVIGATTLPAVHALGHGNDRVGFPLYMAIICTVGSLMVLVPYLRCRERIRLPVGTQSFLAIAGSLLRNRAWIVATIVLSLFYLNMTAFYGLSIYYAVNLLGRSDSFGGTLIAMMGIGKVLGVVCAPLMVRLVGQKMTIIIPYILSACFIVAFYFSPNTTSLLIGCFVLVCFFEGMTLPSMYMMVAESLDYGTKLTGTPSVGIGYSINSFAGKVAWAVGGTLSASMLALGGYVPGAAAQTALAKNFIVFGYLGVPLAVALLSIIVALFYPSRKEIAAVLERTDLAAHG